MMDPESAEERWDEWQRATVTKEDNEETMRWSGGQAYLERV
jgi:hypothetical protein